MTSFHLAVPNTKVPMCSSQKVDFHTQYFLFLLTNCLFILACAEELFNEICKHPVSKFIKTLKEINIAFLPYESQVETIGISFLMGCRLINFPNFFFRSFHWTIGMHSNIISTHKSRKGVLQKWNARRNRSQPSVLLQANTQPFAIECKDLPFIYLINCLLSFILYLACYVFRDYERNAELAQLVQHKLDAYKADEPTMGEGNLIFVLIRL